MLSSGNNLNSSSSSGITSSDMPLLPQCLPLDSITVGNQKYTGELRRVLGVSAGSTSEDHVLGVSHPKPTGLGASGELKHFKESVQHASRKARDRSKMFRESISKLDGYREALNSKKRQRSESSSDRANGVNLTKIGSQIHKNPNDSLTQRSEGKITNSMLNKRIRTTVSDLREESRSATSGRQQMLTEKDGNLVQTLVGSSVRNEEKTRRLLAGGEGLDQKIKKKRSVGAVGNRVITGERDVKRATLLTKANADLKTRLYDAQGFRLKSLTASSGINKSEGYPEPNNTGVRTMLTSEQGVSLHRDHIAEQKVGAKGNIRANTLEDPASSPNTLIKNKVSRSPRTGSVSALEVSNIQPASGTFPVSVGSSIHPMTRWVGQRPPKHSRSRRVKVVSPASRNMEVQVSSEGCLTSDFSIKASVGNNGFPLASSVDNSTPKYKRLPDDVSSPFGLSESEESGAGENKIKEKGVNGIDFALAADKDGASMLPMRKNKIQTEESGDSVQRQGRTGRNLSSVRPGLPSGREKSDSLSILKPVQDMRPNDKSKTKYGRPPSKKQKERKFSTRVGKQLNIGSSDFGGESDDDREELLKAANAARNASNLACSGSFWNKMEYIFASISLDDASFLKQQLNIAEEFEKSLSHMCGIDHDMLLGVVIDNKSTQGSEERKRSQCDEESTKIDALGSKNDMERLDKATPLFQRLLCALIEEDDNDELYHQSEAKNISRQCASDDSHCGSCNQIDFEPKDRDRMDFEVESRVDFQIQKNCILDRLSCDKSTTSNTFRHPNTSSSLQSTGVWQEDEEFSLSDITHTGEIWSNDLDQLQPAELSIPSFPSPDGQYQLMSLDDKLLLELQRIGLYPEILPDLTEEDEAINEDIVKLEKALYEQNGRKKKNLGGIDGAIQKAVEMEKRKIEQAALDQLIEMAYRKRLACHGNKLSKGAVQKVPKQVALAFLKRTLGRCKRYEEAGVSCFSEPTLQNILFAPHSREVNDAQLVECIVSGTASNTCNKASNQIEATKSVAVSSASEKYHCQRDYADQRLIDSFQGSIHSSEQVYSKNGSVIIKEKKREMLVNGVVSVFSRTSNLEGDAHGGVKGKRSERDGNQTRQNCISRTGYRSLDSSLNENKLKAKAKQKSNAGGHDRFMEAKESAGLPIYDSSLSVADASNNCSKDGTALSVTQDTSQVKESSDLVDLQLHDLSSIDDFGVSGDLGGPQDLSSWLNFEDDGLQDHGCIADFDIPMDDLSELNMLM